MPAARSQPSFFPRMASSSSSRMTKATTRRRSTSNASLRNASLPKPPIRSSKNALRDPISGEIGKSIIFAVSQHHAMKLAQILNLIADKIFPGKYQSDFAVQVTSKVTDAQQFTINFANNNLLGTANFLPSYRTSKARVRNRRHDDHRLQIGNLESHRRSAVHNQLRQQQPLRHGQFPPVIPHEQGTCA